MSKTGPRQEKYMKVMYLLNPDSEVYEDFPSMKEELLLESLWNKCQASSSPKENCFWGMEG